MRGGRLIFVEFPARVRRCAGNFVDVTSLSLYHSNVRQVFLHSSLR